MRTFYTVIYGLCVATSIALAQAEDAEAAKNHNKGNKKQERAQHRELSEEHKKVRQEILAKYDANKDGKLDRIERGKLTNKDKERLSKLRGKSGRGERSKKKES